MLDILGVTTLIVARTDAEGANLLDSNIDQRDHRFICGATVPGTPNLRDVLAQAGPAKATEASKQWYEKAAVMRFEDLVAKEAGDKKDEVVARFFAETDGGKAGFPRFQEWAKKEFGRELYFDMEAPRSREGYYRIRGGVDMCTARCREFIQFGDLVWFESAKPVLKDAKEFSEGVLATYPDALLAYNLSPSFNWDSAGLSEEEMANFNNTLGSYGYVFQFITLAGFHLDGLEAELFAREYAKRGIIAYVEMIQRQERINKIPLLTHQKWSGAELIDRSTTAAAGGLSSTAATSAESTENQFKEK